MDPNVLLLVVIIAAIYLLILAPARNRKKRADDIKAHLKPGAEVMTTSGMFGTVVEANETEFHIEVSPGVVVRFVIGAVGKITMPKDGDENADKDAEAPKDGDPPPTKTL
ncbi:MAG: preprotein translocase subunit YajC [Sporichthyaceae bacterium]